MQKPGPQIDSRIEVVTPENIAFQYRVAGPFRRMPAYLIDILIRIAAILVARWAILLLGIAGGSGLLGFGFGAMLVIWFVLEWFYGGLFETFWNGQTPGKWAVGVRVVATDGQPINALQAVMRNVLRAADALPVLTLPLFGGAGMMELFLYQVGLWVPAFNDRYQRLGDLACGTMVVIDASAGSLRRCPHHRAGSDSTGRFDSAQFRRQPQPGANAVAVRRSPPRPVVDAPLGNRPAAGRTVANDVRPAAANQRRSAAGRRLLPSVLRPDRRRSQSSPRQRRARKTVRTRRRVPPWLIPQPTPQTQTEHFADIETYLDHIG